MANDETYEFEAKAVRRTRDAVLLDAGDEEIWVPQSLLEEVDQDLYAVPMWWAVKEGIA